MASKVPTRCLEENPDWRTIYLAGVPIRLEDLHVATQVEYTYLSKILSGARSPSTRLARAIAKELGMTLDAFFSAVDERQLDLHSGIRQRKSA